MKKTYKKIIFKILLLLIIVSLSAPPAYASEIADSFSDFEVFLYGFLDAGTASYILVTRAIDSYSESMDVDGLTDYIKDAELKIEPPEVDIVFSPTVPIPGQKVTAFAQTKLFMNSPDRFFYTWMLKHNDGIDADDISADNLEEYKINAAKIIANSGFDWVEAEKRNDYADGASDEDADGYDARDFFGGDDQKGKRSDDNHPEKNDYHCFIFNRNNGLWYPDDSAKDEKGNIYGFPCFHLFPCRYNKCDYQLGDGEFTTAEEKYWKTDPLDEDTSNSGTPDEATTLGLGVKSFSWIYQEGDVVAVAVEGVSIYRTKLEDNSYKITWAFSGEGCPRDDYGLNKKITDYRDFISKYCLPKSFLDPTTAKDGGEIEITLDYFPEFPTATLPGTDMNGVEIKPEDSDLLSIEANVSAINNYGNLQYDWKVYGTDISGMGFSPAEGFVASDFELLNSQLVGATPFSGVEVNTLKFGLFFPSSPAPKTLKIVLNVKDTTSGSSGSTYAYIPISSAIDRLGVYSAVATASANGITLNIPEGSKPGCVNPNKICQVTPNEIIAVEANDATYINPHWTINGDSIYNPVGRVGNFHDNLIYFPVKEKVGNEFELTMTADKDVDGKIERAVLKKTFKVVKPGIEISCVDPTEKICKNTLLGKFIEPDRNNPGATIEVPDYSLDEFEAIANTNIELKATYSGPPIDNLDDLMTWTITGVDHDICGQQASFTTGEVGDSHSVQVSMFYAPSEDTKKALYNFWGISFDEYYEKEISAQIKIDVVEKVNDFVTEEEGEETIPGTEHKCVGGCLDKKPLASLFSGITTYFIFLFKIILTVGLLIFLLGIFSSLTFNRERE